MGSVPHTVFSNVLPAMAASLLALVYNLADTVFIAQTHNDLMIAAVSLAAPIFLLYMSFGTLFGVGGASVISRALGEGDRRRAERASSFCTWAGAAVGVVSMALCWIFMDQLLGIFTTSAETTAYTRDYLSIVNVCGLFSVFVNCYSYLVRSEGKASMSMWGTLIGNLVNLVLDPVFILGFGWGVRGAAWATVIGNALAALYYLICILTRRYTLSVRIKDFPVKGEIPKSVLSIGVPAALTSILMSVSQIIVNAMIACYGDLALAGYAIAGKLRMCLFMASDGIGKGMQPVLGYFFGAGNKGKFKKLLSFSLVFSLVFCIFVTILCFFLLDGIVRLFLTAPEAFSYGVDFSRIMLYSTWFSGFYGVLNGMLQAVGAAMSSLIAAVARQGLIYLPLLPILEHFLSVYGLVWAQPAAEALSTVLVIVLSAISLRKFLGKHRMAE